MCHIKIPTEAKKIIDKLYEAGYEAYIVGGCVRDALLGREAEDYDITTSATPLEIKRIFERTVDTGISHGTVTVIENGKPYEVTTFRVDGEYKDNRHPVSVSYTSNIRDDLARRDFTVNALAYNDREGIVDAFSGISDLQNQTIRCVRDPEERFSEDALRVLRGIRFASVLGFKIEERTADAIRKYSKNLASISSERILAEWKKLLSGKNAYDVIFDYKEVIDVFAEELKNIEMPPRDSFCGLTYDEIQILLFSLSDVKDAFLCGAEEMERLIDSSMWWKSADGGELPAIDREVIALTTEGKVVFAHRPKESWRGKNIDTGEVTTYYPERYGAGQWNIPDIKWWLDIEIPLHGE